MALLVLFTFSAFMGIQNVASRDNINTELSANTFLLPTKLTLFFVGTSTSLNIIVIDGAMKKTIILVIGIKLRGIYSLKFWKSLL